MTTPTGPISLAQQRARILLADSATFRTWTGTASQAAALNRIHLKRMATVPTSKAEWIAARPFCIVDLPENNAFVMEKTAGGRGNYYVESGAIMLQFESEVADPDDLEDSRRIVENQLGVIFSEMWDLSGNDGATEVGGTTAYLNMRGVDLVYGPIGTADDEKATQSDYILTIAMLNWGT